MPEKVLFKEKKYQVIIYHGHLHKIPLNKNEEEPSDRIKVIPEESIKQDTS
jgi:hypothetical protein